MLPRDGSAPGTPDAPKLPLDDDPLLVYSLDERAADAFESGTVFLWERMTVSDPGLTVLFGGAAQLHSKLTCIRMCSSLTGLGMNPTSQPSLTNRPIHQLLSYFSCKMWEEIGLIID